MRAPSPPDPIDALPEALRALARRGERLRFPRGAQLIREGEHGSSLFVILAGKVRAFGSGDNERQITYGVYGPGEDLGEMSLDGGPRSASVETLEPTECAMVSREALERHIAEVPAFAFDLLARVIARARAATDSARQLAVYDVYGRLLLLFDALAVTQDDGTRLIAQRMTQQEMADRLGCRREMVSRLLGDLSRGGFIERISAGGWLIRRKLPARW